MTFKPILTALLGIVICSTAQAQDLRHPSLMNSFCVDPQRERLCPDYPNDQIDFSDKFVYMLINVETQSRFDIFSWQAFVSLNWPELGRADAGDHPGWQAFRRREQVFHKDVASEKCTAAASGAQVITSGPLQADGNVLIDQSGNFIVYETRLNDVAEGYILDNVLDTAAGQIANIQTPISCPQGRTGDDPARASVLTKTAWRILPPGSDTSRYIIRDGLIHVPANQSATGRDLCIREKLGLIGMHIVSRTQSGNGDEWLWSTFEHAATAPTAENSRQINSIYYYDLFPGGCKAPAVYDRADYTLHDPDCPNCATNQTPEGVWTWAATPPYARVNGATAFPSPQIVRCWAIFEGTREVNELWQAELQGTVLENYNLISTQWRGADKSPMFEHGEVPRYLSNLTMESYLQFASDGTCLGCHADAETATGGNANFTFLLREAQ